MTLNPSKPLAACGRGIRSAASAAAGWVAANFDIGWIVEDGELTVKAKPRRKSGGTGPR